MVQCALFFSCDCHFVCSQRCPQRLLFGRGECSKLPVCARSTTELLKPKPVVIIRRDTRERLGKGSFGAVRLLEFPMGYRVAMKMQNALKSHPNDVDREYVLQELAAKSCPLCLAVLVSGWQGDTNYALLEAGFGGSLDSWVHSNFPNGLASIEGGRLAQLIFAQIVLATMRMHQVGITHSDMKPANIIVMSQDCNNLHEARCQSPLVQCTYAQRWIDNQCAVKIADYGLACVDSRLNQGFPNMHGCTNAKAGTPVTMAPEVFKYRFKTTAVDVWALGAILYFILYNRYMFTGNTFGVVDTFAIDVLPANWNCRWGSSPRQSQIFDVCSGCIWQDSKTRLTAAQLWNRPYVSEVHASTLHVEQQQKNAVGHSSSSLLYLATHAPVTLGTLRQFYHASGNPFNP
eukprot:TRINITY_DN56992_c0_g1_i1.p1 TRINITY_DN56992_c0_g1~~TRINITY_DN56992_c0_g1_i1.p1  ORF type:complete len:403 (-),score=18.27 TRINITY_DN56992_c0_g1_i1:298-1506(-)